MRKFIFLLLAIGLVSGLAAIPGVAQNEVYVAYPLDNLHGSFGHWNPFGAISSGSADECREQLLIQAPYLPPTGGLITAIEVAPHVTGTVPYQNLTISMGHSTVNSLTMTFAANLANPVLVYAINNQSINWPNRTTWQRITLQAPFRYDGQSNLVIEFQRIIDRPNNPSLGTISHQYTTAPNRKDLPWCVWANGAYGSGAAQASTATYNYNAGPLLIRVVFAGSRALVIDGSRASGKQYFHLGGTATLTVQALPGEFFFDGIDFGLRGVGLSVPPINGEWWLPAIFNVFWISSIDAQGKGIFTLPIPNVAALVGTHVYFQSATAGSSVDFTNVVDAIVAP